MFAKFKIIKIIFLLILVFSLYSCGAQGEANEPQNFVSNQSDAELQIEVEDTNLIEWSEAINHIGETVTVYGEVKGALYSSGSNGQPTFINLGVDYPDSSRCTVVIWGEDRPKFSEAPEIIYAGQVIYVTGLVELYEGTAEIIVDNPSQISYE